MGLRYVKRERGHGIGVWWESSCLGWHWSLAEPRYKIVDYSFTFYVACFWIICFIFGWERRGQEG